LQTAEKIIGNPRGVSLHCGGVVITQQSLRQLVPIHRAAKAINDEHLAAVAWEKDGVEQMGLVKSDLLGNRSLAVIRDTVDDLTALGITIPADVWQHPDQDTTTAALVARGATMGCFYIESPAPTKSWQRRIRPLGSTFKYYSTSGGKLYR
jgi:DNA polymerase-3 subunit alpha/error-prone DNA polymerase